MQFAKNFVLGLLVSGLMALPGFAQSSGSSQSSQQSMQQDQASATAGGSQSGKMSDQQFLKEAAQDNLAEIQIAKLAEQKSSDPQVKQMAQKLQSDHQQNQQQLEQVAQQQGVTLPTQPDAKKKAIYDKLSKLNGRQFDQAFLRMQTKDHHKDVKDFKREEANASSPAVKSYASQTLPTLENHLQMSESTAQQAGVKVPKSKPSQSARNNSQR